MTLPRALRLLRQRLLHRDDAENVQVAIRIVIVSTAMAYFHSDFFANNADNAEYVFLARWAVSIAFVITVALLIAMLAKPGISVTRRVIGLVHDVTAISTAMFLGEAGTAAVSAIYLWVTLGNGFRYGTAYLYACAVMSFVGFGMVYLSSDYWQEQGELSITILILLTVIPPYIGRLLTSLYNAKAELKKRASFDGLTGLMNRAEFEESVASILAMNQDGHYLLFCDLDHFKAVNDEAGHAAGDKLLADVGKVIQECMRRDDLTARVGGDEFAVFLKHCPQNRVRAIAETIRNTVSGYRLAWGTEYFGVGISIGAAPSAAVKDMDSLVRLADSACYAAKDAGRNQVHIVDADTDVMDTQSIRRLFDKENLPAQRKIRASGDNAGG